SFTDDVLPYIVNKKTNANSISENHKVSKVTSQNTIKTSSNLCKIIKTSESNYMQLKSSFLNANNQKLFKLPPSCDTYTIRNSLIDGYDYFYKDFIKLKYQPKNKLTCLICENEVGNHWDHIIPKSKYPIFSLSPVNLVLICEKCNKHKGGKFNFDKELPFHPLFDTVNIENEIEIKINFTEIHERLGNGLTIDYKNDRIKNLVQLYDLHDIIRARSFEELAKFVKRLFSDVKQNIDVTVSKNNYLDYIDYTNHNTIERIVGILLSKCTPGDMKALQSKDVLEFLDIDYILDDF
ncbi:HNH endonuclease, partial [Leuconostoc mesenteroides]